MAVLAQTDTASPEIEQAQARLEKLRGLVEAGVAPRAQLIQEEENLADAEDAALLRRTIYGQDLTDAQSDGMIAAADRRLERRAQAFDRARKLVDAGAAPRASLDSFQRDIDLARAERDLAVSRAQVVRELTAMAEAERAVQEAPAPTPEPASERHDGDGVFTMSRFAQVESAF